jgi:hypothetical protein
MTISFADCMRLWLWANRLRWEGCILSFDGTDGPCRR